MMTSFDRYISNEVIYDLYVLCFTVVDTSFQLRKNADVGTEKLDEHVTIHDLL